MKKIAIDEAWNTQSKDEKFVTNWLSSPGCGMHCITALRWTLVHTSVRTDTSFREKHLPHTTYPFCSNVPHYNHLDAEINLKPFDDTVVGKRTAVPLQAWSGPEGSRKLRFPDFMKTTQGGGKVVSLTHRPPLPPGNTPGTHFS